jgi:hypothetical protein
MSPQERCKKICDALSTLGMIETNDLDLYKLSNVTPETFELLYFIINDLLENIRLNSNMNIENYQANFLVDEDFQNTLDPILLQQSTILWPSQDPTLPIDNKCSLERFNRKIQVLDNPSYLREYRNILESTSESLIPPNRGRLISSITESSQYLSQVKINPKVNNNIDATNAFIQSVLQKLIEDVDTKKKILQSKIQSDGILIELNQETESDKQNGRLDNSLTQIQRYLGDFKEKLVEILRDISSKKPSKSLNTSNMLVDVDSNLGASFNQLSKSYDQFNKIVNYFNQWSSLITNQNQKAREYEEKSDLLKKMDLPVLFESINEFNKGLNDCLNLCGENFVNLD